MQTTLSIIILCCVIMAGSFDDEDNTKCPTNWISALDLGWQPSIEYIFHSIYVIDLYDRLYFDQQPSSLYHESRGGVPVLSS